MFADGTSVIVSNPDLEKFKMILLPLSDNWMIGLGPISCR
jgi:hypothetical protein